MNKLMLMILVVMFVGNANAAVLCESLSGGSPYIPASLSVAATSNSCRNTNVVVTSPQVVTTAIVWPADRELKFEKGGYVTFTGSGSLTGLKEARPEWFGDNTIPGTTDMSVAFQSALNSAKEVIADGVYLINGDNNSLSGMEMQSGQYLHGTGTLIQGTLRFLLTAGTGDGGTTSVAGNKTNIRVSGLTLKNNAGTFSEQRHLMLLSAVSHVLIDDVKFIGFQGDGLYIASGTSGTAERHNQDITVRNSLFDGVNFQNRNGITVIDVDGLLVEGNKFTNCTKSNMPGAIDVEPNGVSSEITKNIRITNNRFINTGGSSAPVTFYLPKAYGVGAMTTPPSGFEVSDNLINPSVDSGRSIFARFFNTTPVLLTTAVPSHNLDIFHNTIPGAIVLMGVRGTTIADNDFSGVGKNSLILSDITSITAGNLIEVGVWNNTFTDTGGAYGATTIGNVSGLHLDGNIYTRISQGNGTQHPIIFFGSGVTTTSDNVSITNNKFVGTHTYDVYETSHSHSPTTTFIYSNVPRGGSANNAINISLSGFLNATQNYDVYAGSILPDSMPAGERVTYWNGDAAAPDVFKQGVVRTIKTNPSAAYRKFVIQWYYPANNDATSLGTMYFRKGEDATNTWSAWKKLTGV